MPPPNITGKLHMGHALFLSLQDSLCRHYKNQGQECLWLPGLDHAGLATYEKIQSYQSSHGLTYDQASKILPSENKAKILEQIQKLGALPDWDHLQYTLDPIYEEFTLKILKSLFDDQRISYKEGNFYLDLNPEAKALAQAIREKKINIYPEYESKNLLPFLDSLDPWCISRQIPWGTKLPLFYQQGEITFDLNQESKECLDTWFNSSLWPLASLMKNPQLIEKFYPAFLIETGADILFFWCGKMLMMGLYLYNNQKKLSLNLNSPWAFKDIYLHGIIRDKKGQKFSKSLNNGIDPLEMIKKYGADATRLFLLTRTGPSEDILFNEQELITYKKFMNKIWQAGRFFSIYASKFQLEKMHSIPSLDQKDQEDLKRFQNHFNNLLKDYRFLESSRWIHSHFKEWFCDQWIENHKALIQAGDETTIRQGIYILHQTLAMIEPFCPFICQEIYDNFFS